ncbi:DUF1361 domain-containing protein [Leeuwenhoekiella sp. NPDC079379]|uniref:DUF1361 domain-containing protein n=1 Tax=Leeuwenhoekiella sp. NPDC079379 TaxID=3364122 RepID=UPI0037C7BF08
MKTRIETHYTQLKFICIATICCAVLLMIRLKITRDFFGLFLVWNLFLASIPLGIVWLLKEQKTLIKNNFIVALAFGIWLLFLPNSPYILTDLIHLSYSNPSWFYYDSILIISFAITGLYFGFLSIYELKMIFRKKFNLSVLNTGIIAVLYLSALGIYLGRILRFNSWDILANPTVLFKTLLQFVLSPVENSEVWLFTFIFGTLLTVLYFISERFLKLSEL